jgi:polysaccharide biosynthesis/export protein VpsN
LGCGLFLIMKRIWKSLATYVRVAPLLVAFLCGCETTGADKDSAAMTNAMGDLRLGADILRPGDHIKIIYNDIPQAPQPAELQIPDDGKLVLHMGVEVNFANKRRTDVEREIEREYIEGKKYYKKITITIERAGLFVSVGGYVRTPMNVPCQGDMTVVKAVNAAGGWTEYGAPRRTIIQRSNGTKVKVDLRKAVDDPKFDLPVYPGDKVYIPKGNF